ncbi:unnamed protein product [Symbiodinium natans]|uniref:Uncharacterized protein n=1 Tax=Symbiodinium natans TaxID=878477 RepID=A0A812NG84_9DINO|nr:unnamed protein product [Symbiodinium natans]
MAAVRKSRSSREGSLMGRDEEEMPFLEKEIKGYKQVICQPASLLLVFVPFGFMGRTMEWTLGQRALRQCADSMMLI